jgi:hypothetical protein
LPEGACLRELRLKELLPEGVDCCAGMGRSRPVPAQPCCHRLAAEACYGGIEENTWMIEL